MKYIGNFFSLPNEIFLLGLSPGELAVYCYLRRCENQKTHQCWPSYKTIGDAVGMCENTVSKYIQKLSERGLIAVEPTKVTTKTGVTRNGTLRFTLLPNVLLSATKLLHHMGRIFQDNSIPPCPPGSQRADRKLRQKIRQKKIAMGHKPDDHEEEENMGGMTMGGM